MIASSGLHQGHTGCQEKCWPQTPQSLGLDSAEDVLAVMDTLCPSCTTFEVAGLIRTYRDFDSSAAVPSGPSRYRDMEPYKEDGDEPAERGRGYLCSFARTRTLVAQTCCMQITTELARSMKSGIVHANHSSHSPSRNCRNPGSPAAVL